MCPLWERDIDLLATQRRTVLLQRLKVTALYELYSPIDFVQNTGTVSFDFWSIWTSSKLGQNQFSSCQDLQNYKPVESDDVQQNFWSSGFFGTWSSESSSLRTLETFIRTSVFRIFSTCSEPHLQRLGLFIRTSCLRVFRSFLANLQNMLTLMIFWFEPRLQKRFEYSFACASNFWLMWLLPQSQNLLSTQQQTLEYQNCSFN